jgi:hypothetical protein
VTAGDIHMIEDAYDRFEPWEGSTFEHAVEVVHRMNRIIIERFGSCPAIMMNFSIVGHTGYMTSTTVSKRGMMGSYNSK